MNSNRRLRQGVAGRPDVKLGRMVLVSLGLHLIVFLIFSGLILPRFGRVRPPVYFVDLVNLPVARPQAGRPDVRPEPAKPKPAAAKKVTRPEPKPAPPPPPAKPKLAAPLKTAPPAPKPPKSVPKASYDETLKTIEAMQQAKQRQQEIDELKAKLAELAKNDTRQSGRAGGGPGRHARRARGPGRSRAAGLAAGLFQGQLAALQIPGSQSRPGSPGDGSLRRRGEPARLQDGEICPATRPSTIR